ncbi:hypothetical protein ASC83_22705 [Acidovorax sp. Root402]|nr:hypothetical protein ASC83_22705 [Acidovorax sp. Root402]
MVLFNPLLSFSGLGFDMRTGALDSSSAHSYGTLAFRRPCLRCRGLLGLRSDFGLLFARLGNTNIVSASVLLRATLATLRREFGAFRGLSVRHGVLHFWRERTLFRLARLFELGLFLLSSIFFLFAYGVLLNRSVGFFGVGFALGRLSRSQLVISFFLVVEEFFIVETFFLIQALLLFGSVEFTLSFIPPLLLSSCVLFGLTLFLLALLFQLRFLGKKMFHLDLLSSA